MPNFNKCFLMGNLTKDVELRYTAGGAPVANIRMAINHKYKSKTGDVKEDVCFVTVVVWNKQAEACAQYVKKGEPIFVEGRLQSKSWETEDKQKRTTMEVVAERIQFLKGKSADSGPDEGSPETTSAPMSEEDIPF